MKSLSDFLTSKKILHNPTPPKAIRLRPPLNLNKEDLSFIKERLFK